MPCFRPLQAYQGLNGAVVFSELKRHEIVRSLQLPCGQCVGCRLERSRQWAIRCVHEAALYKENCFVTLTYDEDHVAPGGGLHYRDWQLFMKKLRKKHEQKIRFYMCGEYGEELARPHFHACLFNIDFKDKKYWKTGDSKSKIYRSEELEEIWKKGFSTVGEVNFESAAYVARYIMKKVTGDRAEKYYERVDEETGEIWKRRAEFNKMSLKPGIGAGWMEKFESDIYPEGEVVINARKVRPPKFYDRLYKRSDPDGYEELSATRDKSARSRYEDNTDERLLVKEQVLKAKIRTLTRRIT